MSGHAPPPKRPCSGTADENDMLKHTHDVTCLRITFEPEEHFFAVAVNAAGGNTNRDYTVQKHVCVICEKCQFPLFSTTLGMLLI
jgi:hypothetical protein